MAGSLLAALTSTPALVKKIGGNLGNITKLAQSGELAELIKEIPQKNLADLAALPETPRYDNAAHSVMNAKRLARELSAQEAASIFNNDGTLKKETIDKSLEIRSPDKIKNTSIPKGYSKYTTGVFHSPSGDFEIHFYKNNITGEIYYGMDYKAKFKINIKKGNK